LSPGLAGLTELLKEGTVPGRTTRILDRTARKSHQNHQVWPGVTHSTITLLSFGSNNSTKVSCRKKQSSGSGFRWWSLCKSNIQLLLFMQVPLLLRRKMITNKRDILSRIETLELRSNYSYNNLQVRFVICQRAPRSFAKFVNVQKVYITIQRTGKLVFSSIYHNKAESKLRFC
jgi:hypothetical protein